MNIYAHRRIFYWISLSYYSLLHKKKKQKKASRKGAAKKHGKTST